MKYIKGILVMFGVLKADSSYSQTLNPYQNRNDLNQIYNLIFCDDVSLYKKNFTGSMDYPWSTIFNEKPSEKALTRIIHDQNIESRQKLLAYRVGEKSIEEKEPKLLGIVIEVGLKDGLDVLAAFKDGSARYINHSGNLIIWDQEDVQIKMNIDEVFNAGEIAIRKIGPWEKARLPAPKKDNLRITFLTSNGIYFGEGSIDMISHDEIGGQVVSKGTELMLNLIKKATEAKK